MLPRPLAAGKGACCPLFKNPRPHSQPSALNFGPSGFIRLPIAAKGSASLKRLKKHCVIECIYDGRLPGKIGKGTE